MAEKTVGIRQLKAQLSEYIREIKKGNTVLITVRGNAVGRMIGRPQLMLYLHTPS